MYLLNIYLLIVLKEFSGQALAQIDLGTAAPFGIIASSAITNTGATIVTGSLGLLPNTRSSITGFSPGISGVISAGNGVADQALQDARTAYNAASSLATASQIPGADLGGQTLAAGTYASSSSVGITGTLTLNGQDDPNALFVFQISSTLTTSASASVVLINGARACNVYFQVGSSATLGSFTNFNGNILALTSVSLLDGVSVNGGLYALNGAVTLINDRITPQQECAAASTSIVPAVSTTPTLNSITAVSSAIQTSGLTDGPSATIPGSRKAPDTSDIPDTTDFPSITVTTPIFPQPSTLVITSPSKSPRIPDFPEVTTSSEVSNLESSIKPTSSATNRSSRPTTAVISVTALSTRSVLTTRSSIMSIISTSSRSPSAMSFSSTDFSSIQTTSVRTKSTTTKPSDFSSRPTSLTHRSRSTRAYTTYYLTTSTDATITGNKYYRIYTTNNIYNTSTSLSSRSATKPHHFPPLTTADTTTTPSFIPHAETTTTTSTPCRTLTYYEPTCACTKTTILALPATLSPTFTPATVTTINGTPCAATRYCEPTCDCVKIRTAPLSAVAQTASTHTVVSGVPYVAEKYIEEGCGCVRTAMVAVRVVSGATAQCVATGDGL